MAEKHFDSHQVTIMKLKVDLQCAKCYKKVKKILCKFPEIRDQVYDEKNNIVTITVVCYNPEKIRDKLCYKGCGTIKTIEIVEPLKLKPSPAPKSIDPPPPKPKKTESPVPKPDPPPAPAPDPVPMASLPIGMCCVPCYEGRPGGPCFDGYGGPSYYEGYYGRPVYDNYGGGRPCDEYTICEDNSQQGCTIM